MKRIGFTLTELLVVIIIICVLAGLLFPLLVGARNKGYSTRSLSNLHQCYLAATLYSNDDGGWGMLPKDPSAAGVFDKSPTCDPLDTWRHACVGNWGPPLVGSYGYGGLVYGTEANSTPWDTALESQNASLLVDVFVADEPVPPVHGLFALYPSTVAQPTKALHLLMDGSVKLRHEVNHVGSVSIGFSWGPLFGFRGTE